MIGQKEVKINLPFNYSLDIKSFLKMAISTLDRAKHSALNLKKSMLCRSLSCIQSFEEDITDFFYRLLASFAQTNLTVFLPKSSCHLKTQLRSFSKHFQACKALFKSAASASFYQVCHSAGWERLYKPAKKKIANFKRTIYVRSVVWTKFQVRSLFCLRQFPYCSLWQKPEPRNALRAATTSLDTKH